jgi:hypothetical protein
MAANTDAPRLNTKDAKIHGFLVRSAVRSVARAVSAIPATIPKKPRNNPLCDAEDLMLLNSWSKTGYTSTSRSQ